jgi:hypothetical protein
MKTVVLLLPLLGLALLPLGAGARQGAAWRQQRVKVVDRLPPLWQPAVAWEVGRLNAVLPKRVPRLVHAPGSERACRRSKKEAQRRRIVLCLGPEDARQSFTIHTIVARELLSAVIRISPRDGSTEYTERTLRRTLCHELMHALTAAPDVSLRAYYSGENDQTSCVGGIWLAEPGPSDITFAGHVYRKYGDHRSTPRDRARRKYAGIPGEAERRLVPFGNVMTGNIAHPQHVARREVDAVRAGLADGRLQRAGVGVAAQFV